MTPSTPQLAVGASASPRLLHDPATSPRYTPAPRDRTPSQPVRLAGAGVGVAAIPSALGDAGDGVLDDAALVARCRAGDAAAWAALVQRYQRLVLAVARRAGLDGHEAADVFQTVFSRLVQHLSRIVDPGRLQAWIVTTTKREAQLQRRRGRRSVSMSCADEALGDGGEWDRVDDSPGAEEALDQWQQLDRLRSAMDRLDPRSRDLMLLLFRDDEDRLSYDEIARRLAIPVGSIGPTRSRCLAKLRRLVS